VSARLPLPLSAGYTYMRWFHKPSGRLMVATPTMRDELIRHGFRNISPWTRGVDTDVFKPRVEGEPDVFEGLARPIFLNVGRVAVEKNIEAFASLDLPGTTVIVGDGPQREELAEKYPNVVFAGAKFGEELARYFACADVFCFPSLTDTFGLVILEAMAAGVPVAAFSAPGSDRHHPRLGGRRAGPGPDRRACARPAWPAWTSTTRRCASSPRASRGAPAPRSSTRTCSPIPSRKRPGSGGGCDAWRGCGSALGNPSAFGWSRIYPRTDHHPNRGGAHAAPLNLPPPPHWAGSTRPPPRRGQQ
jgi:hypothetical protein